MLTRQEEKFFKKFGKQIREIRSKKGFSQEDMAYHGFSTRFYQRIEAGKPIHFKTVLRLAKAFKCSVKDLIP